MKELIAKLLEKRAGLRANMDTLLEGATTEARSLTDDEKGRFEALESEIRELDDQVEVYRAQLARDEAAADAARKFTLPTSGSGGAHVTDAPVYHERSALNFGPSFIRDLAAVQKGDVAAAERLHRNNKQVMEARAISTSNGAGGEFVPPLWMESAFVKYVRPGRVTVDLTNVQELPNGTDSINIPKITGGTATAVQATQNNGVQQTDLTTSSVNSAVITIAGGQTVSMQLVEQSPLNIDEVVLQDLAADYAVRLSAQVISGSGTGGNLTGILNVSGLNSVAWTQATPSIAGAGGFFPTLAKAIQAIHTSRYAPPSHIVMHPRRWAWVVAQSDGQNRPLVVPNAAGPYNAMGEQSAQLPQGLVGTMLGLPVVVDPNLPTNLGAGTNQDPILVAKYDDLYTFEGNVKAEAFNQTYANQLSLFVRLYNYVAFIGNRYPQSIAVVNGTGSVTPTF